MNGNELETEDEEVSREQLIIDACKKVFRTGVWLVKNGYGNVGILPYRAPSGCYWRCEFHPLGRPSKPFFKYSTCDGERYLANHCGGSIRKDASAKKIAEAILVSVPEEVRESCQGEASMETLRWLDQAESYLQAGYIPEAFHEFTDDYSSWALVRPYGNEQLSMAPMPGYVPPGYERKVVNSPFWADAGRRFKTITRPQFVQLSSKALNDDEFCFLLAKRVQQDIQDGDSFDAMRLFRAALGSLHGYESEDVENVDSIGPIPISLTPSSDLVIRRACRLLSMVHELHKVGYQRLRICSGSSYDKSAWHCLLMSADNVLMDGWTPLNAGSCQVYSTADGKNFFGWKDADGDDARKLAVKFAERFPEIARAAYGPDWAYAGWFAAILGAAENGMLPKFYEGMDSKLPEGAILPPASPCRVDPEKSGTGCELISNDSLRVANLPQVDADDEEMCPFCLSFDGYAWSLRSGAECEAVADAAEQKGLRNCSMDELRVVAFIRQRAIKWGDSWPPEERLLQSIRSAIGEIRLRLS